MELLAQSKKPFFGMLVESRKPGPLLGRTLKLLEADQVILADVYLYLHKVTESTRPTFAELNTAFGVVLANKGMRRTKDTFYANFFKHVADAVCSGKTMRSAFDHSLRLYMLPRSAAIFSHLRQLSRLFGILKARRKVDAPGRCHSARSCSNGWRARSSAGCSRPRGEVDSPTNQLLVLRESEVACRVRRRILLSAFAAFKERLGLSRGHTGQTMTLAIKNQRLAYLERSALAIHNRGVMQLAFNALLLRATALRSMEKQAAKAHGRALSLLLLCHRFALHIPVQKSQRSTQRACELAVKRYIWRAFDERFSYIAVMHARCNAFLISRAYHRYLRIGFDSLRRRHIDLMDRLMNPTQYATSERALAIAGDPRSCQPNIDASYIKNVILDKPLGNRPPPNTRDAPLMDKAAAPSADRLTTSYGASILRNLDASTRSIFVPKPPKYVISGASEDGGEQQRSRFLAARSHELSAVTQTLQSGIDEILREIERRSLHDKAAQNASEPDADLDVETLKTEALPQKPQGPPPRMYYTVHDRHVLKIVFPLMLARATRLRNLLALATAACRRLQTARLFWAWRRTYFASKAASSFHNVHLMHTVANAFIVWRDKAFLVRSSFCAAGDTQLLNIVYKSQCTAFSDMHKRFTYLRSLSAAFMVILDKRRLIRALVDWRYALVTNRLCTVATRRHNLAIQANVLALLREEFVARRFAKLLQTPYPCGKSSLLHVPLHFSGFSVARGRHPTYADLVLLALGALVSEAAPGTLDDCPTLKRIQKAAALSEHYRSDDRPLKRLSMIDTVNVRNVSQESRREILGHCVLRWRTYVSSEIDKKYRLAEFEATCNRRLLTRVMGRFKALTRLSRHAIKLAHMRDAMTLRSVLRAWRRALGFQTKLRVVYAQQFALLLQQVFRAWRTALSIKNSLRVFAEFIAHYSPETGEALKGMLGTNVPLAHIIGYIRDNVLDATANGRRVFPLNIAEEFEDLLKIGEKGKLLNKRSVNGLKTKSVFQHYARNRDALASSFSEWRFQTAIRLRNSLVADTHHEAVLRMHSLRHWRVTAASKKDARLLGMASQHYAYKRCRTAMSVFAQRFLDAFAHNDEVSSRYLLRRAFKMFVLRYAERYMQRQVSMVTVRSTFTRWRVLLHAKLESEADVVRRFRLLTVLRAWCGIVAARKSFLQAKTLQRDKGVVFRALGAICRIFTGRVNDENRRVDVAKKALGLSAWHRLVHARKHRLHALSERLRHAQLQQAFDALLTAKYDARVASLEHSFVTRRNSSRVAQAFTEWRSLYTGIVTEENRKVCWYRKLIIVRAWLRMVNRRCDYLSNAIFEQNRGLKQRALSAMGMVYDERRQAEDDAVHALRKRVYFTVFRMRVKAIARGRAEIEELLRLACMRNALVTMLVTATKLGDLGDRLFALSNDILCRRVLRAWRQEYRLEGKYSRMERMRLLQIVRKWAILAREHSTERRVEVVAERFERKKILNKVFFTWAAMAGIDNVFSGILDSRTSLTTQSSASGY